MNKQHLFILIAVVFFIHHANAQYAATKVKEMQQAYSNSQKGFDLPISIGVIVNDIALKQGFVINNMQLGIFTDNQDHKNWIFKTDCGTIGDHKSILFSANWRFLLKNYS